MTCYPTIDKARDAELTTSEVEQALQEIASLDGMLSGYPSLRVRWAVPGFKARVCWGNERDVDISFGRWFNCIEDALVWSYDDIAKGIADEKLADAIAEEEARA